jgi:type I restriction enzyme S subunit
VLLTIVGTIGRSAVVHEAKPAVFQRSVAIIRPKASKLDAQYLFHATQDVHFQDQLIKYANQSAQAGIYLGKLAKVTVPLPPLPEQRRIAAILDKADALRRKRKRAIDLLDSLTQSIFLEMFGDPKAGKDHLPRSQLGDVADFYSGNSLPEGGPFSGQIDGYLLLKVSDLNLPGNEKVLHSAASWSNIPGAKAGTCNREAVVFPKRGGAIGTNKKRRLLRPAILDPNLMAVVPREGKLHLDYLYAWFQCFRLEDISSGSSVPQLNKQDLAPLEIRIPPIDMQDRFSNRCRSADRALEIGYQLYVRADDLFASLQSRAFSGQL